MCYNTPFTDIIIRESLICDCNAPPRSKVTLVCGTWTRRGLRVGASGEHRASMLRAWEVVYGAPADWRARRPLGTRRRGAADLRPTTFGFFRVLGSRGGVEASKPRPQGARTYP